MGGADTQFVTSSGLPFVCLFVCFFVFFARRPDETPRPIATLNGSYDAVSAKEVPFGVSMTKNNV